LVIAGRSSLDAEKLRPILVGALKDKEAAVRLPAALILTSLGKPPAEVIPLLVEVMRVGGRTARPVTGGAVSFSDAQQAVATLEAMGPAARQIVPALVGLLKQKSLYLPQWAASILGAIGPDAASAIPELVAILK